MASTNCLGSIQDMRALSLSSIRPDGVECIFQSKKRKDDVSLYSEIKQLAYPLGEDLFKVYSVPCFRVKWVIASFACPFVEILPTFFDVVPLRISGWYLYVSFCHARRRGGVFTWPIKLKLMESML